MLACIEIVCVMCVCCRLNMLLLDECLVRFCVGILSVVGICLSLVGEDFFLCSEVMSVLARLLLVVSHLFLVACSCL